MTFIEDRAFLSSSGDNCLTIVRQRPEGALDVVQHIARDHFAPIPEGATKLPHAFRLPHQRPRGFNPQRQPPAAGLIGAGACRGRVDRPPERPADLREMHSTLAGRPFEA
jgi:hypothetical protein